MTYLNTLHIDKINYDLIELIYEFREDLVYYLENPDPKHKITKISYSEYLVNDIFKITIYRKPYSAFKADDLVYVKLENKVLYNDLEAAITFIQKFFLNQNLSFKGLKSLDICLDIEGDFLFNQIDLNTPENYISLVKKGITRQFMADLGKTLYFNTRAVGKQQRATGIVYQKDKEIIKSKKTYQNPDNKVLTRVELKFRKLGGATKENELLRAVGELMNKDLKTFIKYKEILIQYIYREWQHQYNLKHIDNTIILDYELLFKKDLTDYDLVYLKDFIHNYKNNISIIKKKEADKKKDQRNKKDYIKHKNLYIKELEKLKESFIGIFKKTMTLDQYIKVLEEQKVLDYILDTIELDYLGLEPINFLEKAINGNKIKEVIHIHILEMAQTKSKLFNQDNNFMDYNREFNNTYGDLFNDID